MKNDLLQSMNRVFLFLIILIPAINGFLSDGLFVVIAAISSIIIIILLINSADKNVGKNDKHRIIILLLFLILIFYMVLNVLTNAININSLKIIFQMIIILCTVCFSAFYHWGEADFLYIRKLIVTALIVYIIWGLIFGIGFTYKAFFNHSNTLGSLVFCYMFFLLSTNEVNKKKINWVWIILAAALLIVSGSRTAMLSLLCALFIAYLWKHVTRNKFRFYFLFFMTILIISSIILIYPNIVHWDNSGLINNYIREFTGKNLLSGRQLLWPYLLDAIKERIMWGYGLDKLPRNFIDTSLSSHNLYIQLTLQYGLFGLGLFILLVFTFWRQFWLYRHSNVTRWSAAFLLAFLLHECFEVSLTQNNFGVGILMWVIMSIGIAPQGSIQIKRLLVERIKNKNIINSFTRALRR